MVRSISLTETAKIIRKELKDKLPLTKFSVRCEKSSNLTTINISWEDGYTESDVSFIADRFGSKEEMQIDDHIPFVYDSWEGEQVKWGSHYINYFRSISDYYRQELEDFFLDYLDPLLKGELVNYRENPREYQSKYIRKYIAKVNLHDKDRYARVVRLDVDRSFVKAYPCPSTAEDLNLFENHKISVSKLIRFEFDPNLANFPESFLVEHWIYKNQILPDWAFYESESKPVFAEYPQPITNLTIDGAVVEGKIVDFIRADNLESESLEEICDRFYSLSNRFYCVSYNSANNKYQVVHNTEINRIQFIFEIEPSDYIKAALMNRGFENFGKVFQQKLDRTGVYAAEQIIEKLQNN